MKRRIFFKNIGKFIGILSLGLFPLKSKSDPILIGHKRTNSFDMELYCSYMSHIQMEIKITPDGAKLISSISKYE